jgi:SAM-dependent methyltransferase
MDVIKGNIYDYPKYYDLLFGADWKAEYDFLRKCFKKHARRPVQRLFEPACGTGRLLVRLAKAGFEVAGNDLNPKAAAFCNDRLQRQGFPRTAVVGDMADFRLRRKVDAAFNTINSFRHLDTEQKAESHLRCVAGALAKGGLYVLGFHLTPERGPRCTEESWSARKGHLMVNSRMRSTSLDRRRREEWVRLVFDVYTPTRQFRLDDKFPFRTYTAGQFARLLGRVKELELAETYDFTYDIRQPIEITATTEDVIYVLRKV